MAEANPNLAGLLLASGSQILSIRSLLRLVQRGSPEETAGSCWVCRECASVSSISRDFPSKDLPGVQSQLLQCFPAERAASPQRATKAVARHSPRHRLHRSRRPSAAPREGARTRGGRGGVGGAQGVRGGLGAVTSAGLGGASGDLGASSRVSPVAGSLAAAEVGICSEEHRSLSAQASRNALCAEG